MDKTLKDFATNGQGQFMYGVSAWCGKQEQSFFLNMHLSLKCSKLNASTGLKAYLLVWLCVSWSLLLIFFVSELDSKPQENSILPSGNWFLWCFPKIITSSRLARTFQITQCNPSALWKMLGSLSKWYCRVFPFSQRILANLFRTCIILSSLYKLFLLCKSSFLFFFPDLKYNRLI